MINEDLTQATSALAYQTWCAKRNGKLAETWVWDGKGFVRAATWNKVSAAYDDDDLNIHIARNPSYTETAETEYHEIHNTNRNRNQFTPPPPAHTPTNPKYQQSQRGNAFDDPMSTNHYNPSKWTLALTGLDRNCSISGSRLNDQSPDSWTNDTTTPKYFAAIDCGQVK